MRIHRQNGRPEPPPGRADHPTDVAARHLRWRPRRRRNRGKAPASDTGADQTTRVPATGVQAAQTAQAQGAPGEPVAASGEPVAAPGGSMIATMQLAIALLTAG